METGFAPEIESVLSKTGKSREEYTEKLRRFYNSYRFSTKPLRSGLPQRGSTNCGGEALAQIDAKEYLLPWTGSGKKLFKEGVSFDLEKRNIGEWKAADGLSYAGE